MKTFPVAVLANFVLLPFFFFGMVYTANPSPSRFLGPQKLEPDFLRGDMENFLQKPPENRPLQITSTLPQTSSSQHEYTLEKTLTSTSRQSKCKFI